MRELVIVLIGMCVGTIAGVGVMFALMGKKIRDQFLGYNLENKPIVIEWLDGHTKDINIMMRGVLVFTGVIHQMYIQRDYMDGQRVHIEIVSKAEVMRDFSS